MPVHVSPKAVTVTQVFVWSEAGDFHCRCLPGHVPEDDVAQALAPSVARATVQYVTPSGLTPPLTLRDLPVKGKRLADLPVKVDPDRFPARISYAMAEVA